MIARAATDNAAACCNALCSALLRATGDLLQGAHVLLLHQHCSVLWCTHRKCTSSRGVACALGRSSCILTLVVAIAERRTLQHVGPQNLLLCLRASLLRNVFVSSRASARQDQRARNDVRSLARGGCVPGGAPGDQI